MRFRPQGFPPQPLELQNITLLPLGPCPSGLCVSSLADARILRRGHAQPIADGHPSLPVVRLTPLLPTSPTCTDAGYSSKRFLAGSCGELFSMDVRDAKCGCAVVEIVCPAVSCGQAQRWEEVALEEAERPAPRGAHSAVCDPKSHTIVVFGGAALSCAWNPAMCRCSRTYTYLYNFKSQNWQKPG